MDKIKTVKIKELDGSISEETYTIAADAINIDMENGYDLQETIGIINIDIDGDIASQLRDVKNNKIDTIDIVDNLESEAIDKVLSAKQGKELKKIINDNTTDLNIDINKKIKWFYVTPSNTQAEIQDMMNTIGAKIIEFENSEYTFDTVFNVNSNTKIILNNSTLNFSYRHGFFNFNTTDVFTEYNGNGNIEILNGTIKGGNISFCHGKHIILRNLNFIDIINDHVLELAANKDFHILNCNFEGVAVQPESRNYVECIQIDDMTRTCFPWFDTGNDGSYDRTPNDSIYIDNCIFDTDLEKEENYTIYVCIGGHSVITGIPNKNIYITNCYFSGYNYAGIRPYNWKNTFIRNNKFINKYLYNEEENSYNFIRKDCLSVNDTTENFYFENNYTYGTTRLYWSDNTIKSTNININNNTFEYNNWDYTIRDEIKSTNLANAYLYLIFVKQIADTLNVNNNKYINSEKVFLRTSGYSGTSNSYKITNINNNIFDCNMCFGILVPDSSNTKLTIRDNVFNISSVYNNEYGSIANSYKAIIKTHNALNYQPIIANNTFPWDITLTKLNTQPTDSNATEFTKIKDLYTSIGTPDAQEKTNSTTIYNRPFNQFNGLILTIGTSDSNPLTSVIITADNYYNKLKAKTYYFNAIIDDTNTINGEFTINEDLITYSYSLSNYRIKTIFGFNK